MKDFIYLNLKNKKIVINPKVYRKYDIEIRSDKRKQQTHKKNQTKK